LKDPEAYVKWYGWEKPHPYPDILKKAVYGLPEIHRDDIRNAQLVAVPGCMATAGILSLLPLRQVIIIGGIGGAMCRTLYGGLTLLLLLVLPLLESPEAKRVLASATEAESVV